MSTPPSSQPTTNGTTPGELTGLVTISNPVNGICIASAPGLAGNPIVPQTAPAVQGHCPPGYSFQTAGQVGNAINNAAQQAVPGLGAAESTAGFLGWLEGKLQSPSFWKATGLVALAAALGWAGLRMWTGNDIHVSLPQASPASGKAKAVGPVAEAAEA